MLLEILEKLITFQTITEDGATNAKALQWIEEQLKGKNLFFTRFLENSHPSLIITTHKTKKPKVLLEGHMDVVPGPDALFLPQKINGKLIGRGAYDMKFALACFILLLKELEYERDYSLGVMITTDEEIGGLNGAKVLVEKGYGAAEICFLPDGGENWNFESWSKGIYRVKIASFGKNSHASRPWRGDNAIVKLMASLHELQKLFVKEPCSDPLHAHTSMAPTIITGGTVQNQIPDVAEAILDIRYIPATNVLTIKKEMRGVLKQFKGVSLQDVATTKSFSTKLSLPEQKVFSEIAKKYGKTSKDTFSHGASDARFFIDKEIPTMLTRPKGGNLHADGEWIDIADLELFYKTLKEYVLLRAKVG